MIFTKIVKAPTCQRVVLTVVGFDMAARGYRNRCETEGIEIRLGDVVTSGTWYCDDDLSAGQVLKSTSDSLIMFYVRNTASSYDGFSFDITFETNPDC